MSTLGWSIENKDKLGQGSSNDNQSRHSRYREEVGDPISDTNDL